MVRSVVLPLLEAVLFSLSGLAVFALLFEPLKHDTALLAGALFAALTSLMRGYAAPLLERPREEVGSIGVTGVLILFICAAVYSLQNGGAQAPALPFVLWATAAAVSIVGGRWAAGALLALRVGRGAMAVEVVVVTHEPEARSTQSAVASLATRLGTPLHFQMYGVTDLASAAETMVEPLLQNLRQMQPNEILLDLPANAGSAAEVASRARLFGALRSLPSRIWITVPSGAEAGSPQLALLMEPPMEAAGLAMKRALDVVGALALLVALGPLLLLVAAAIRVTSPGPALFRQRRWGYNNQVFEIYKFRSMRHDLCDEAGAELTTRDDPRVTRIGRFIRRTSIDELPQLFNVLNGDMSLVGPRPHPLNALAGARRYGEVVPDIDRRHRIRPGITGLAQINGFRGNTDTEEKLIGRVRYDFEYIENWSFWLDLKILIMTPVKGLFTENAY